jgi:hypothetical protein
MAQTTGTITRITRTDAQKRRSAQRAAYENVLFLIRSQRTTRATTSKEALDDLEYEVKRAIEFVSELS